MHFPAEPVWWGFSVFIERFICQSALYTLSVPVEPVAPALPTHLQTILRLHSRFWLDWRHFDTTSTFLSTPSGLSFKQDVHPPLGMVSMSALKPTLIFLPPPSAVKVKGYVLSACPSVLTEGVLKPSLSKYPGPVKFHSLPGKHEVHAPNVIFCQFCPVFSHIYICGLQSAGGASVLGHFHYH